MNEEKRVRSERPQDFSWLERMAPQSGMSMTEIERVLRGGEPDKWLESNRFYKWLVALGRANGGDEGAIEKCTKESGAALGGALSSELLQYTIAMNRVDLLKQLIEPFKESINANGWCDINPLMKAAEMNHLECLNVLLKAGANVAAVDLYGNTPLWYAASQGHIQALSALMEAGSNMEYRNNYQKETALMKAVRHNQLEAISWLVKNGANVNPEPGASGPLHTAAESNQCDAMVLLMAYNAKLNVKNAKGDTPVAVAVIEGNYEAVEMLIRAGADCSGTYRDSKASLLHLAAYCGSLKEKDVLDLLIHQFDLEVEDCDGATALMRLAETSTVERMQKMIEKGASIKKLDFQGRTLPFYALNNPDLEEALVFLGSLGLDLAYKTVRGEKLKKCINKKIQEEDLDEEFLKRVEARICQSHLDKVIQRESYAARRPVIKL